MQYCLGGIFNVLSRIYNVGSDDKFDDVHLFRFQQFSALKEL